LYVQRFFLGVVESVVPTGFMCVVSGWYTQREQGVRQGVWFSSTGLWTVIGGGLNYVRLFPISPSLFRLRERECAC
jgi:hypothetical protein